MFAKSAFAAIILATAAMAQSSYDCESQKSDASVYRACQDCQAQEQADIHTIKDYQGQLKARGDIQACYFKAVDNQATLNGPYSVDDIHKTCVGFPLHNNADCGSQLANLQNAAAKENSCRSAPNANQATCSSDAANDFYATLPLRN